VRIGGRRPPAAPDPDLIRMLADLLAETGLSEIEYAVGDCRVRVARDRIASPPSPDAPAAGAEPVRTSTELSEMTVEAAASAGAVTAPMVGVAYLAPQPGAPAFVRLGDTIIEGQVLLVIEAMKVMNQIRAPHAGRLTRILVDDAQPVEYGAVLMLIE